MERALIAVMIATAVALAGCNTVHGAGKDVASVGNTVANTAQDAK